MREGIDEGEYLFYTVAGKINPADGLTKYVSVEAFKRSRDYMGIVAIKGTKATVIAVKLIWRAALPLRHSMWTRFCIWGSTPGGGGSKSHFYQPAFHRLACQILSQIRISRLR
jgi:hypothetical protein